MVVGPARKRWSWPEWLAAGFLFSVGIGLARLGVGLWGIARLTARSKPIEDRDLVDVVEIVRAELSCAQSVEIREVASLSTPATIGWRRPLLLFPSDWREWTVEERRAVVAHELAHVNRGDFLAGLLAQVGLALQFYHPMAHWLATRLRLEQELAADAWGARLSGGKPIYLATLARMALRRESRAMTWPARAFLPSHGTFIRRIEMLRNSKQLSTGSLPFAIRLTTILALGLVGLSIAAFRGPIVESSALAQEQPVAQSGGALVGDGVESYNLAYLPADTKMVLAIRPSSVLRRRDFRSLVNSITKGPPYNRLQFVAIEDIEQVLVFWSGETQGTERSGASPLIPMFSGFILRTKKPQDWKSLKEKEFFTFFPEEVRHSGQSYFRPGPNRTGITGGIYMPDDRTLIAAQEELLPEFIEDRNAPSPRRSWDEVWKKVSKGQVMLGLETRWLRRRIAQARLLSTSGRGAVDGISALETLAPLLDQARAYGMGIRISDQRLSIDLVGAVDSEQDGKRVAETLQAAVILGKNFLQGARSAHGTGSGPRGLNEAAGWVFEVLGAILEKVRIATPDGFVHLSSDSVVDIGEGFRLLVPVVSNARVATRRAVSVNNLKQIGLAFHNYHAEKAYFPASINLGGKAKRIPYSWRVAILPYIGEQELYKAYNFDEPWDGPNNRKLIDKMPAVYGYPGPDGTPSSRRHSAYFVFAGDSTAVGIGPSRSGALMGGEVGMGSLSGRGAGIEQGKDEKANPREENPRTEASPPVPSILQITDGTSNTILAVEAQREIPWTKPEDIPFTMNGPLPDMGGFTADGFNALFADGSVKYLKKTIPALVFKALITRDGGEVISSDSY